MNTKLDKIVKECQKEAYKQNCNDCQCTEEECMECLNDTYQNMNSEVK